MKALLKILFVLIISLLSIRVAYAGNNLCGLSPEDWCAAEKGDLCGEHTNTADCEADLKCVGLAYRGESVVACQFDERGFASNCPTVGCVSACSNLNLDLCKKYPDRCQVTNEKCQDKPRK